MRNKVLLMVFFLGTIVPGSMVSAQEPALACDVSLIILGIAQDAGRPQLGHPEDAAWQDADLARSATSIGLVDSRRTPAARWLFEATPDVKIQLQRLDEFAPTAEYIGLQGIFLTHAHMGHYLGLAHFGHEAARTSGLLVYAMPEMKSFLENNGPWDQLVRHENVVIRELGNDVAVDLADDLLVTPFEVPHRREYSETVGYLIVGPRRSALFIPDINSWELFDDSGTQIETLIADVDYAFVDATFYGDELPNISQFPHPKILESMSRFDELPMREKQKIRFIHLNHSNPALRSGSPESEHILDRGYQTAKEGEHYCLGSYGQTYE